MKRQSINKSISTEDFIIPHHKEYELLNKHNYKVHQLKSIGKYYKLKLTGCKYDLHARVYTYLKQSYYCSYIQRVYRGYLVRRYNKLHGPAYLNRSLCVNETDFLNLEEVKNIPYNQFYSFKDNENFIYGFDIASIYNIILKEGIAFKNPYNRSDLSSHIVDEIKSIIRLSNVLKIPIQAYIKEVTVVSYTNRIKHRIVAIFQAIDQLGNYSDHTWFTTLTLNKLCRFIRELVDIWNYRAEITPSVKLRICPPIGDPFRNVDMLLVRSMSFDALQRFAMNTMENLVNSGIDIESRSLGAIYILTALTLVSDNAAASMPWLYQSVVQ